MDQATATLLIRLGGELGAVLIKMFRAVGNDDQARQLEQILGESDATYQEVRRKAQVELTPKTDDD